MVGSGKIYFHNGIKLSHWAMMKGLWDSSRSLSWARFFGRFSPSEWHKAKGSEWPVVIKRWKIYAIVETGGKQYKVAPKQTIEVERLNIPEGDTIELDRVLFIGDNGNVLIGNPTIEGAKVIATSLGEIKGDKVIVFKYKSKVRYRRKTGHRQIYTRLSINEIVKPGG